MTDLRSAESEGTILYDGACGFCSRWVGFWATTLRRHGFQVAALQEPWSPSGSAPTPHSFSRTFACSRQREN